MASRLTNVAHTQGATNLATVGYTLNAVGNRTVKNVAWASLPMHSEIYTYDPIDQLVTANYNGSNTVAYDYDPVGNRTSVSATTSAPGVGTYTTNNLNQYTNAQGKVNLHDSRGNLTKVGIDLTFAYDSKNRLTSAQNGTNAMTVTYDYQNRQVSRTINGTTVYFIYDGWSLLEERDATGNLLQTYVHGPEIDEILWKQNTTGEVYYHHDGLGSTIALTDETGAVVESYQYDAFGSVSIYDASNSALSASPRENRFLFTDREWIGEIGIYDYRNRIYSPELGRFLQTDPIRFDAGDVNLYRYVGNDSVNEVDPYGLESLGQSLGKAGSVRSYKPASPKIPVGKVLPLINAGLAITDQLDCNEKAKQARSSRDETCNAILCPDARAKCLELSALIFRIEVVNCAAKAVAKVAEANAILGKLGLN